MKITINCEERTFSAAVLTLEDVFASLGVDAEKSLVLLNGEAPEKSLFASVRLKDGDILDIMRFAGGG